MKKKYIITYFSDNNMILFNSLSGLVKIYDLPEQISKDGLIHDSKQFQKSFREILKEEQLNKLMFGFDMYVITPPNFTSIHKIVFQDLLENFNIKKLIYKTEKSLYLKEKNITFLNINHHYIHITTFDKFKNIRTMTVNYNIFQYNLELLFQTINSNYLNKKKIYIIGNLTKIESIINIINKLTSKRTIYFANHKTYLIEELKNKLT